MPMYGRIGKTAVDQTDKEAEYYRSMVVAQGDEIAILRNNVKELQGQLQQSYKRIAELREALDVEVAEHSSTRSMFDRIINTGKL